jgi:hypothetical protein
MTNLMIIPVRKFIQYDGTNGDVIFQLFQDSTIQNPSLDLDDGNTLTIGWGSTDPEEREGTTLQNGQWMQYSHNENGLPHVGAAAVTDPLLQPINFGIVIRSSGVIVEH